VSNVAIDPALQLAVRSCLALLLTAAARHKLGDLARFRSTIENYRVVPPSVAALISHTLPALEVVLAMTIASGMFPVASGAAAAVLFTVYALAIAVNVRRGRSDLDCGCMGPASAVPVSSALVVRNVFLVVAAGLLTIPVSARELTLMDDVAIAAFTAALAACWAASERMLALAPRVALARRKTHSGAAHERSRFADIRSRFAPARPS